ncbi:MAG: undecaprenyldiphospho-muramoylpentapeptide beta-N-acetylglucosaminyltransferase [Planctomycetota bacterium]|jgi:UDP-N-acetylglucosamine--N-acetylmuramyl-(pentapeptide) pyrophosphoryl-undecaprenol N-acetylglucosamine transferase
MSAPRIIIAGGGTGGHVAPAIAIGDEIADRYGRDAVHFLCSGNEIERRMIGHAGYPYSTLRVSRPRAGLFSKAKAIASAAIAVPAARRLVKQLRADALLSVGGYVALPGALGAAIRRTPVYLLEANAVPGKVNRTLSSFAKACFAHLPLTRSLDCRVEVRGNPVRRSFVTPIEKAIAKRALGLNPILPTLLVVGGSQGADAINTAVIGSLASNPQWRDSMQVLHVTGRSGLEAAEHAWIQSGIRHRVTAFTNNTPTWFAASDIALTRAGAGTISELLCVGVPMLLVPYPHAKDDHQRANAAHVVEAGAGIVVEQDSLCPERFTELIEQNLLSRLSQERMKKAALEMAVPQAASDIVDRILDEIGFSQPAPTADNSSRIAA